jgi:uncharacterized protein YaiI (UPF0178 family)
MSQEEPAKPTIWVDADACPRAIKDVLFRAADRRSVRVVLVANQYLRKPPTPFVSVIQVESGFDVADRAIVERLQAGDLVITADIPLADEVITKGGTALTPRGMLYTRENIKDHLSRRDMMDELRSSGMITGGPPGLDNRDVQAFANGLDRFLTRALAERSTPRPESP